MIHPAMDEWAIKLNTMLRDTDNRDDVDKEIALILPSIIATIFYEGSLPFEKAINKSRYATEYKRFYAKVVFYTPPVIVFAIGMDQFLDMFVATMDYLKGCVDKNTKIIDHIRDCPRNVGAN